MEVVVALERKVRATDPPIKNIFCGHAGIADECRRLGYQVRAVDRQGHDHLPGHPVFRLDLTGG